MSDMIATLEAEASAEIPFDAGDSEQVNEARKKAGRRKTKERDTLKTLMGYENGRELMYNSVKCLFEGNPVVPQDAFSTYYNLGQEFRARELFKEIVSICPEEFATMMNENRTSK